MSDVLSFPMHEELPGHTYLLGEVIINIDQLKRQAKDFKVSEKEELARLFAHGVLHLLGMDDVSKVGRAKMKKIEDRVVMSVKKITRGKL